MHMSIPRENVPGVLWIDRPVITEALVHTLRIASLITEADPVPDDIAERLGEHLDALPDEDIAELHYAVMEMGVAEAAIMLNKKIETIRILCEQIDGAFEEMHGE